MEVGCTPDVPSSRASAAAAQTRVRRDERRESFKRRWREARLLRRRRPGFVSAQGEEEWDREVGLRQAPPTVVPLLHEGELRSGGKGKLVQVLNGETSVEDGADHFAERMVPDEERALFP